MPWWGWIVIGTLLFGAELFAIDAQFYLIFIGIGAIIVGLAGFIGIEMPLWVQWLLFAALSLTAMFTVRRQLYQRLHSRATGTVANDVGHQVVLGEELAPGKSCRIEYRGSMWTAINVGDQPIAAGSDVRIEAVEGLALHVRRPAE